MKEHASGIASYLTRLQVAETGRPARTRHRTGERDDDVRFARWLDLLVMVCPGPLSGILAPAALARQQLAAAEN